ncbi:MAG: hypothetical protein K9M97_12130, partial [Akkermansiaceae bacterium]|nr:hypothetical protein [Akkermansiaceae bacterium]
MKPKFAFRIRSVCSATRKPPASQGRSRSLRRIAPPSTALLCGIAIALTSNAPATTITWIGGNADWVDGGTGAGLWSPADEPDSNDDVIFNTDDTVKLGSNNTVLSLALSGSIILETNDFDLTVDGLLQLAGSGTNLTIGGSASSVVVDSAVINSGGRIILEDGALRIVEETGAGLLDINSGGSLSGQGAIHFDDALAVATTLMRNDGTLAASYVGLFQSGMLPPAGTLTIPAGSAYARIDLDGTSGNGIVTVGRNQTLDLNVALSDPFSGDLNLFHRSTIDVSTPWSIDASSTVDIDNGALTGFPAIAADTSYIAGVSFIQNGGTITVIDTDGTLQFDAPFTQNGGDLVNNGLVVFNADATIGTGANLTMPGSTSSLTVNPGVTVNIDQPEFNADGTGSINNVLTVESGGNLDLDLGTGADASLTGSIRLNGGELDVTTGTGSWTINGPVTMGANSGTSQINGEAVTFTSTAVTLGENSVLRVNAASTLSPTASFAVATNATLGFPTAPVFNGASFTGDGIMRVEGASEVAADTTIGVHFFDWDWNALGQTHRINAGVTFTINSPVWMDPMDDSVMLVGGGSTLNVNGPTAWNMDGTLVSNPAASTTATVGGTSHANFGGAINANSGNTLVTAPATLAATSTINVGPGALLSFNSNTIFEGGASSGSGILRVGSTSNINADTTIDVDTFDWDGTGVGSLQSISDGVTFTINSANFDTDGDMDDPIKLGGNGATLAVNGPASWTMLRTLTTNLADTGVATITGSSRLILTSATGSLVADGDTTVDAPITLGPSSVTDVAASAVLALNSGGTVFDGGTVTGAGALQVSSSSVVTADTLIDVNTFDWDGPFVGSLQSIGDGVT